MDIVCFCFGQFLSGHAEIGFRDSASFYQPLFEWTRDQWFSGQVPLWCSLDNWGGPVVADATSSVFYPAKLIFLIKPVPFSILFGVYLAGHVLWAVFGTRWCAKVMEISQPGQWLAACGFGFGGYVLFQTCNVVFLVGAAWLPWALGCIWSIHKSINNVGDSDRPGCFLPSICLAITLSMMVLAGDPQIAMHTVMVAVLCLVLGSFHSTPHHSIGRSIAKASILIVLVTGLAVAMSAIQVWPSIEWAAQSERSAQFDDESGSLIERPAADSPRSDVYQFSQAPWTIVDMFWPNVLGKLDFATNLRWSSSLAGADRIWSGSIYMGLIVVLLSAAMIRCGPWKRLEITLMLIAAFFLFSSFGWYGFGWLINELQLMRGGGGISQTVGEPTGGLYWILENVVPGYDRFRYPAKLVVVFALAMCLVAGRGLDRLAHPDGDSIRRWVRRTSTVFAVFSIVTVLFLSAQSFQYRWLPRINPAIAESVFGSALHCSIVSGLLVAIVTWHKNAPSRSEMMARLLVMLGVIELMIAVTWTVCLVEKPNEPVAFDRLENSSAIWRSPDLENIHQFEDWDQLATQLQIDRQTLYPKYHLLRRQRLIGSWHSIQPLDTTVLLDEVARLSPESQQRVLTALGATSSIQVADTKRNALKKTRLIHWDGRPRFYLASDIRRLPVVDAQNREAVVERTREVISMLDSNWLVDNLFTVTVEGDSPGLPEIKKDDRASLELLNESENRIRLEFSSDQDQFIVVGDYFDKNWRAWQVEPDGRRSELASFRTNRILRGYLATPGNYEIELTYQPMSFRVGGWISCLAWSLVVASLVWRLRRRRLP